MPTLRITVERGPDAALAILERAIMGALIEGSGEAADLVITDARSGAKVDTGVWRASIGMPRWSSTPTTVTRDVTSDLPRGVWAHDDTRPHWPPPGALLGWVRRHGMPDSAEFPIRRAISRRGTKGDYTITASFDKNEANMIAAFERALDEALR